jgi:hypothetical protein
MGGLVYKKLTGKREKQRKESQREYHRERFLGSNEG